MNTEEMTPLELNIYYRSKVWRSKSSLFDAIHYSISTENMDLYRALRDAQDALDKCEAEFDKVGA